MSKLALIKGQYRAGGDIFSGIAGLVGKGLKALGGFLGGGGASKAAQVVQVAKKAAPIVAGGVAGKLLAGGGGGGGGVSAGGHRRSRGITARELKGYHKVARLLHREGMVSRHARGRR